MSRKVFKKESEYGTTIMKRREFIYNLQLYRLSLKEFPQQVNVPILWTGYLMIKDKSLNNNFFSLRHEEKTK